MHDQNYFPKIMENTQNKVKQRDYFTVPKARDKFFFKILLNSDEVSGMLVFSPLVACNLLVSTMEIHNQSHRDSLSL